jgi:ATP-dependent DNA ligase
MTIRPMLAAAIDVVPRDDPRFVMEPKYDGWRAIGHVTEGAAVLRTRTGNAITSVPYLCTDLLAAFPPETIVDGEIVDLVGERQWNNVQTILSGEAVHRPSAVSAALTLVIFDVLQLAGEDLKALPLIERKQRLLVEWLARSPAWAEADAQGRFTLKLAEYEPASPERAEELIDQGFEGVVVKDVNSRYVMGARNRGWSKFKPQTEVEATCTGTFPGEGRFAGAGWVGGLTFVLEDGTEGRVGTGFTDEVRREIAADPSRYDGKVIELLHHGVGKHGALRHPVFRRVRSELEKSAAPTRTAAKPRTATASTATTAAAADETKWMRNYRAMGDTKLAAAVEQLRARSGDAYERCVAQDGDYDAHLQRAENEARRRGLI